MTRQIRSDNLSKKYSDNVSVYCVDTDKTVIGILDVVADDFITVIINNIKIKLFKHRKIPNLYVGNQARMEFQVKLVR